MRRIIKGAIKYIFDKNYRYLFNCSKGKYDYLSDEEYLKRYYRAYYQKEFDLNNLLTFGDKLQFIKLNYRSESMTQMVDKFEVRKHVAKLIGEEYLIPLLGVWDSPEEIDFNNLPSAFVLKCNHNSGTGMVICRDKRNINIKEVIRGLNAGLKEDYYLKNREWPYKNVKRRIICEAFMKDGNRDELADYKFYCFNGIPCYCQVIQDRSTHETVDFFDMNWVHQDFTGFGKKYDYSKAGIVCPKTFNDMKRFAKILSEDFPFVRVDFYEINGKLYFGELTFFPNGGFGNFYPYEWNKKIGDLILL